MNVLTIYTDRFDSLENICRNGMSGKVFLEDSDGKITPGNEFRAIDEAMDFCEKNNVQVDRIDFHYLGDYGIQKFRKFTVQNNGK